MRPELVGIISEIRSAGYGQKGELVEKYSKILGISTKTLYRMLAEASPSGRSKRCDAGESSLDDDTLRLIAAMMLNSVRGNGKQTMDIPTARQILQAQGGKQQASAAATALKQLSHGPQMGVAVHFRDDGPDPLRQDHRPLRGHRPPLPVGVAFRGEIRKQGMGAVNELSHAARLLGKGANRPEVRGELGADGSGQGFLRGGRGQIHTAACRKDLFCQWLPNGFRSIPILLMDRFQYPLFALFLA